MEPGWILQPPALSSHEPAQRSLKQPAVWFGWMDVRLGRGWWALGRLGGHVSISTYFQVAVFRRTCENYIDGPVSAPAVAESGALMMTADDVCGNPRGGVVGDDDDGHGG